MRAVLKGIHCADIPDLKNYRPDPPDKFGFYLELEIGPQNEDGQEIFGVTVCTPRWLLETYATDQVIIGRHHLIVFEYNYKRLVDKIERFLHRCDADTWNEVALKVSELGYWEFENYKPH